ncbi:MAG: membrane protein insertase YidC [Chloroflexi bacterium]|nr:membrane protein insertase YidC [Chloroflexota bacterium]
MWDTFIINPFTNALLLLYTWVGNNFTLAIVLFTIAVRLITVPLTMSSQKNSQRMAAMQPQIKELQEKYKDQPEKLQTELTALGYNPMTMVGGCLPMFLQFPIMIGLYRSITHVMAVSPLSLVDLYHAIYPVFPNLDKLVPVNSHFLWLNLALPDPIYILPALVFATTWLSQKLITPPPQPGADTGQAAEMTKTMGITMSVMFGFMSLQFASGLSIYFIVSNLVSMVQYPLTNDQQRARLLAFLRREPLPAIAAPASAAKSGKPAVKTSGKSSKAARAAKAGAKK